MRTLTRAGLLLSCGALALSGCGTNDPQTPDPTVPSGVNQATRSIDSAQRALHQRFDAPDQGLEIPSAQAAAQELHAQVGDAAASQSHPGSLMVGPISRGSTLELFYTTDGTTVRGFETSGEGWDVDVARAVDIVESARGVAYENFLSAEEGLNIPSAQAAARLLGAVVGDAATSRRQPGHLVVGRRTRGATLELFYTSDGVTTRGYEAPGEGWSLDPDQD